MQLLTKSIEKALTKTPLYSQENNPDPKIIVKFFNPCGIGTWYITEGEKQDDGDWLLFGLCCMQQPELGYVLLSDLQKQRSAYGLTIERDRYFNGTMSKAMRIENYLCNC
ncbi:MAG: DUF2958 domain-containing protein [Bacteroidales bacterium]|nr:DUF2958 domain-containing protein [Bacteroidales bacterium]